MVKWKLKLLLISLTLIATFIAANFDSAKAAWQYIATTSDSYSTASCGNCPTGSAARTLMAWYQADQHPPTNEYPMILGWGSNVTRQLSALCHYASNDSKKIGFCANGDDAMTIVPASSTWYHVAATYATDATNVLVYINCKQELDWTFGGTPNTVGTSNLDIGRGVNTAWFMSGRVAEAKVYNRVLTRDEICTAMNQRGTGNENGLVVYYHGDEGGLNTLYDVSANAYNGTLTNSPVRVDGPPAVYGE